jgi:hypothetical protein
VCGELAGAERLACIWVVSWQERSDWLVFGWGVGRSRATGLYLGGELAGAERLACIWGGSWQEQSDWLVFGPPQAGSMSESCQVWPAAGGLRAGAVFTNSCQELGFLIVL